jgi:phosphoribosylaminoimidazole-succinocarboxamide synthase
LKSAAAAAAAAAAFSDADIEAILQKGERDTRDLNDKMNKFTEDAKQFTMDGGLSIYDFKDEVRLCDDKAIQLHGAPPGLATTCLSVRRSTASSLWCC